MVFESVDIHFGFDHQLSSREIRELLDFCFNIGCTTRDAGKSDECWYIGEATEFLGEDIKTSIATDDMARNRLGAITLWYNDIGFLFGVRSTDDTTMSVSSELYISIEPVSFKPMNADSPLIDDLIELVKQLYIFMRPTYVFGGESSTFDERKDSPFSDDFSEDNIPVFWLTVFSPSAFSLEKERVLTAPAWYIEELDDGSVVLVLAPNPLQTGIISKRIEEIKQHLSNQ